MKVLFVARDYPDYLQDAVYHGLVNLLGPKNVIDYPFISRYHDKPKDDFNFPICHFNFTETPKVGEEVLDRLDEFDAIVFGWSRGETGQTINKILARNSTATTVFLDGEDHPFIRGVFNKVDLYFKREILTRYVLSHGLGWRRYYHTLRFLKEPLARAVGLATPKSKGIIPLPFGIIDIGYNPVKSKEYDATFLAAKSSPVRTKVLEKIQELKAQGYNIFLPNRRLSWTEYFDTLSKSRFSVCIRGAGYDTYTYWCIPYTNSVLLTETPKIVIPNNFENGKEAIFAEPETIAQKLKQLIDDKVDDAAIAEAGREKLLKQHTSVYRAQTVLEKIKEFAK
jgi:hypothetical protein